MGRDELNLPNVELESPAERAERARRITELEQRVQTIEARIGVLRLEIQRDQQESTG